MSRPLIEKGALLLSCVPARESFHTLLGFYSLGDVEDLISG